MNNWTSAERPPASSDTVRSFMTKLATSGTAPEMSLRRELHRRGMRFLVNVKRLPGSPDIVLTRARVAVFVDGCFWHRCPVHCVPPKSNAAWWEQKLQANQSRDHRDTVNLQEAGWMVIRVWEHSDTDSAASGIEDAWRERTGRATRDPGQRATSGHFEHSGT